MYSLESLTRGALPMSADHVARWRWYTRFLNRSWPSRLGLHHPCTLRDAFGHSSRVVFSLRAFDHPFQNPAQHRGVSGVRFVLQRRQYATGNRSDIGVAAPARAAKLSGTSTRCRFVSANVCSLLLIADRSSKNHPTVAGGMPTLDTHRAQWQPQGIARGQARERQARLLPRSPSLPRRLDAPALPRWPLWPGPTARQRVSRASLCVRASSPLAPAGRKFSSRRPAASGALSQWPFARAHGNRVGARK
jgi:hypothetical protein